MGRIRKVYASDDNKPSIDIVYIKGKVMWCIEEPSLNDSEENVIVRAGMCNKHFRYSLRITPRHLHPLFPIPHEVLMTPFVISRAIYDLKKRSRTDILIHDECRTAIKLLHQNDINA